MCNMCYIYSGILDVCLQDICIYGAFWMFAYEILHIHGIHDVCLCNFLRLYRGMLDVCLQYIHGIYRRAFYWFAYRIMSSLLAFTWFLECLHMKFLFFTGAFYMFACHIFIAFARAFYMIAYSIMSILLALTYFFREICS